jgi:small-conductance mechanosensitive channel
LIGPAYAQIPGLPGFTKAESPKAAPAEAPAATPAEQLARLQERLAKAQLEITQLEAPGGLAQGAPPGTPETELLRRVSVLQFTANAYNQSIELLRRTDGLTQAKAEVQVRLDAWRGLEQKPPYSVVFVDGLRAEQIGAERRRDALEAQRRAALDRATEAVEATRKYEIDVRQLQEKLERAGDGPDAATLNWQRQLAQLRLRAAQATSTRMDVAVKELDARLAVAGLESELASRRFEAAEGEVRFDEPELKSVRARLDEEDAAIEAASKKALAQSTERDRQLAKLTAALDVQRATMPKSDKDAEDAAAKLRALEGQLDLARAAASTASQQVDLLAQERDLLQLRRVIWESRFKLAADRSSESIVGARALAKRYAEHVKRARDYYRQQQEELRRRIDQLEQRIELAQGSKDEAAVKALQAEAEAQSKLVEHGAATVEAVASLADRFNEDIEGARPTITLTDRLSDGAVLAADAFKRVLSTELLAVEDSIEVDGRKIVGSRSITVGKVGAAILILVLGYLAVKLALVLAVRIATRRRKVDPKYAKLVSRWILWFALAVLVVIALATVKIPLTVFAFLGGAVAIGFGFGMQNLIKNLISGLMILGERPFKLGDWVIVSGASGTVTSIDLRSTTIVDLNGIETLIPNSTFIEQNVTNWTYSNNQVRYAIKLGVAYGSPVRRVMELLREVAERHGHVLKEPAPEVLFEDFGADALQFGLYYWLDTSRSTGRLVASDLRSMIDASFTEHGVVIAFPQRDVHLDAAAPIPVRVVNEPPAAPPPSLPS